MKSRKEIKENYKQSKSTMGVFQIKNNINGIQDKIKNFRKPKKIGAQKTSRNNNSKNTR